MRILAKLPACEIEGADRVLDGAVVEVASGNQCRVWPAMTEDKDPRQTRIAFFMEWRRRPTPEDKFELTAWTDEMMRKPAEFETMVDRSDPRDQPDNLDWLRTGKLPSSRKENPKQ